MTRITVLFLVIALLAFGTAVAQAPDKDRLWTTVGSAGTLDEADTGKVFFDHGKVQMGQVLAGSTTGAAASTKAAVITQARTAVIRYNVTPVDGMFPPPVSFPNSVGMQLRLRFLDTGARARVVAKLVEVDLLNGSETALVTFDSNGSGIPASNNYQVKEAGNCDRRFDFIRKAYYIEASLTVTNDTIAGNAAGIEIIKIGNTPCRG